MLLRIRSKPIQWSKPRCGFAVKQLFGRQLRNQENLSKAAVITGHRLLFGKGRKKIVGSKKGRSDWCEEIFLFLDFLTKQFSLPESQREREKGKRERQKVEKSQQPERIEPNSRKTLCKTAQKQLTAGSFEFSNDENTQIHKINLSYVSRTVREKVSFVCFNRSKCVQAGGRDGLWKSINRSKLDDNQFNKRNVIPKMRTKFR